MNISIKNAPEELVEKLKARAARHRRSLQGELLTILEEAVEPKRKLSAEEIMAELKKLNFRTPSESVEMIREDRDR